MTALPNSAPVSSFSPADRRWMERALRLARKTCGQTSPNPLVGAVLVKNGRLIGEGFHHRAGQPHAEIEALRDAEQHGRKPRGATLYVTLEPCCTYGRTPPCTVAIAAAGIRRVVVAATDPNPAHAGKAYALLSFRDIAVEHGLLADRATALNEAFNHWIVHRRPWVTLKAAMTLDGKIATATGESKWITGAPSRAASMKIRQGSDAILVGVNTVITDDPQLTFRSLKTGLADTTAVRLRRIVLDSRARTPLTARVVTDEFSALTTVVVTERAPSSRVRALEKKVNVWISPASHLRVNLDWLLGKLGQEQVTSLLVEGGAEINAAFLMGGFAHRVVFFYAPKIIAGRDAFRAVGGEGAASLDETLNLSDLTWKKLGADLLLTAKVLPRSSP